MKKKTPIIVAASSPAWWPAPACNTGSMRDSCSTAPTVPRPDLARCTPKGPPRCGTEGSAATLPGLVVEYVNERLPEKLRERLAWGALPGNVALARSAYGRDAWGVKHPHQYRLTDAALSAARTLAMARGESFFAARDFETLLHLAREIQHAIYGLGRMWTYDFAERIGAHLEIGPTHTVYVQCGALVGARNLDLRVRSGRLLHAELPAALRVLEAGEVEDFLCIKKSRLSVAMMVA
jgi:hypothetical protein